MMLVGVMEHRGVAVGHRPRDPQPLTLLEPGALELHVLGERAAVAGCGCEEAQELLGGGVQQLVAFTAEPLALLGMLAEPFQRMRGERGGGVEPAADDQAEVAQDLHVGGRLTVDPQLQQCVHQARSRILPDLHHVVDDVEAHLAVLGVDLLPIGRVLGCVHRRMRRLAVDVPLLELDAHHRQREDRGHHVGQMVDEVDPAGLDVFVECGAGDLVDERLPALDRRW